ncbi:MAG TPA: glycosyltransferase family 4 protein [Actinomycetota bacterium]|nr:glycosyltransferase family 4 protein [Actinomycetota bacterium]
MRVAVLSSVHDHLDTRVFHKEAKSLAKLGHDVTLIAPLRSGGAIDGVRLVAVPRGRTRLIRWLRTVPKVYRAARSTEADVYHFHSPELIPVAWALKSRGAVVYDAHEDFPRDILSKAWIPKPLRRPLSAMARACDRWAGRFCDAVVVVEAERTSRFPEGKTYVVGNFPTAADLIDVAPYDGRPPTACYIGDISILRGIIPMLDATQLLRDIPGFKLVLAGRINTSGLENMMSRHPAWDRVDYVGWVDRDDMAGILNQARVGLTVVQPDANLSTALPHKLFEYMAAGIPVIASDFPLWRDVVLSEGCGVVVDPTDPHAIAAAIRSLLEDPEASERLGRAGRKATETKYTWDVAEKTLDRMYQTLGERR